ncbi:MAG: hypothetical protein IKO47_11455 [Ruminococcus sp.]|nr:hypothetical protein [Ruminococcus sp.]
MKFSEFAQILFSIIGGERYAYTIDLLKSGLDAEGQGYIKSLRSDEAGKSRIRKFLSGKNDITEIAPDIVNSFNPLLFVDYILETIDESRYPELCKKFVESSDNLTIDEDDVPQRLTEIYEQILQDAAKGKTTQYDNVSTQTSKDNSKTEGDNIALSYIITEVEKKVLLDLCKLINRTLSHIKSDTDLICNKQNEVNKLTDSEAYVRVKSYLEGQIGSLKKRLNESYTKLEGICSDLVSLLESKKSFSAYLDTIVSIAKNINRDEYKITMPDKFKYNSFAVMISSFNDSYNRLLRNIDKI